MTFDSLCDLLLCLGCIILAYGNVYLSDRIKKLEQYLALIEQYLALDNIYKEKEKDESKIQSRQSEET